MLCGICGKMDSLIDIELVYYKNDCIYKHIYT